jgi:ATP-dependent exoDNAse (exonuclease V) beta subunit
MVLSLNDSVLSDEQLRILNSDPNLVIHGSAGTGKTALAILLYEKWVNKGSKVAIIVYTMTLKKFISTILKDKGYFTPEVFYKSEWNYVDKSSYDVVIIDEFQDFSINEILNTTSSKTGVFLFGDDEQSIYKKTDSGETPTTCQEIKDKTLFPAIELKMSYRVPLEVVSLIHNVYYDRESSDSKNFKSLLESLLIKQNKYDPKSISSNINTSIQPEIIRFNNFESELNFMYQFLSQQTEYKNIGILLKQNDDIPVSDANGINQTIPGVLKTHEFLYKKGILLGYKYKSNSELIFENNININVMSIHSSKGLEFDCIIFPFNCNENYNYNRNLPYVAYTRTSKKLLILFSGNPSYEISKIVSETNVE